MAMGTSPSVTDWIGSLGSALAFLTAAITFAWDRFRRRQAERLAQARQVDGWLDKPVLGSAERAGTVRATLTFVGHISNTSRESVHNVRVQVFPWDKEPVFPGFRWTIGTVPPTIGDHPFDWKQEWTAGVEFPEDIDFQMASWRGYDVVIRFTDSAGRDWVRYPNGRLQPTVTLAAQEAAEEDEMERLHPGSKEALKSAHGDQSEWRAERPWNVMLPTGWRRLLPRNWGERA